MKLLNVLTRENGAIVVTYHWDRVDPNDFCSKIKSLLPDEKAYFPTKRLVEPSGPATARSVEIAMEVATIANGVEIIQGPWTSRDQIKETLTDLMEKSHPELDQTFRLCRDCLC